MNLITLGCSVTHNPGVKETLSELTKLNLVNLSQSAGCNGLQVLKMQEYILTNSFNETDVIIWQISQIERVHVRTKLTERFLHRTNTVITSKVIEHHYVNSNKNLFDDEDRGDLLCHSPLIDEYNFNYDVAQGLQTLIATIVMVKKIHPKILVYLGWDKAVMPDSYKDKIYEILDKHNVDYLKQPFLEWVVYNNGTLLDSKHPTPESGMKFAEQVLYPKLKELNFI